MPTRPMPTRRTWSHDHRHHLRARDPLRPLQAVHRSSAAAPRRRRQRRCRRAGARRHRDLRRDHDRPRRADRGHRGAGLRRSHHLDVRASMSTTKSGTAPATPPAKAPAKMLDFDVAGMTCGSCAARVQRVLGRQPGVVDAQVNYATGRARVDAAGDVDVAALQAAVDKIGYGLEPATAVTTPAAGAADAEERARRAWLLRVVAVWPVALLFLGTMLVGAEAMMDPRVRWGQLLLATPVQFVVGWPFLREAARRARQRTANMDTLIAMGTLAAYTFSVVQLLTGGMDLYFESGVLIIAFLVLGRYFEARAKGRAGRAISALLELGAKQARVLRGGQELLIDVADVRVGDLLRVRPGEKVPTDGEVVDGRSAWRIACRPCSCRR